MKLTASKIPAFLKAPQPSVRVFLVYGPDSGLAHERAQNLLKLFCPNLQDPFALIAMSGGELGSDKARLVDEMASLAFGGGRRVVSVYQAVESNNASIKALLDDMPEGDSILVIEAGDLDSRSKLRKICEGKTAQAVAIPCYKEEGAARLRVISSFLSDAGFRLSQDALRFLGEILPPDRLAMTRELEKLALYGMGQKEISIEDIKEVTANAGGADADALIGAVAGGNPKLAQEILDRLFEEQTSPVMLFRMMQRHFMRLRVAKAHMEEGGMSADAALKKLAPPVFWKQVDPMTRQLRRWGAARLDLRLKELMEAEKTVKQTGTPDLSLCRQLFLSMAAKA